MKLEIETPFTIKTIALGVGVACAEGYVTFTYAVQQKRIAIRAVAIAPTDPADVLGSVEISIVTHAPERAKIERFADGSTISDMGISQITYALKTAPENPRIHQAPIPTDEEVRLGHAGANWFVQDGRGYLSARGGDRVVVPIHNPSKKDVEVSAVILYRVLHEDASSPKDTANA